MSTENLEAELAESERKRRIAEQQREEAPSLMEKLKATNELLNAQTEINEKMEAWLDRFLERYREEVNKQIGFRKKLLELMPSIVAEIKNE